MEIQFSELIRICFIPPFLYSVLLLRLHFFPCDSHVLCLTSVSGG
jgi:hypothetical protein